VPEFLAVASADSRSMEEVLADPSVSFPLKTVLLAWMERDCVDAADDARLLCGLLAARAAAALGSPS